MPPPGTKTGDLPVRTEEVVDGPGNGLQLELNVFREAGAYSTDAIFAVTGTGNGTNMTNTLSGYISTLQPLASIGYQWNQNALLLGIGVSARSAGWAGAGTTIFFGVTPTYRRYLSPLRTGKLSTFVEFGVTISLISFPGAGGTGTDTGGYSDWGLGASLNFGAEWLFVRNFGLFGKAGVSQGCRRGRERRQQRTQHQRRRRGNPGGRRPLRALVDEQSELAFEARASCFS